MRERTEEIRELQARLERLLSEIDKAIETQRAAGRLLSRLTAEFDQMNSQVKDIESSVT